MKLRKWHICLLSLLAFCFVLSIVLFCFLRGGKSSKKSGQREKEPFFMVMHYSVDSKGCPSQEEGMGGPLKNVESEEWLKTRELAPFPMQYTVHARGANGTTDCEDTILRYTIVRTGEDTYRVNFAENMVKFTREFQYRGEDFLMVMRGEFWYAMVAKF